MHVYERGSATPPVGIGDGLTVPTHPTIEMITLTGSSVLTAPVADFNINDTAGALNKPISKHVVAGF